MQRGASWCGWLSHVLQNPLIEVTPLRSRVEKKTPEITRIAVVIRCHRLPDDAHV